MTMISEKFPTSPKDRMIQGTGIDPDIKIVDPSKRNLDVVREKDLPRHLGNNKNKNIIRDKKDEKTDISFKNKDGINDYPLERAVMFLKKKIRR